MASGLLILLDDIATILDDVAVMSKTAAKQTAGVLGDDLALNAQQVTGVRADREWAVVWGVAKGSFVNKLILVPTALGISVVASWLINPLLMVGGLFLCYEGVEKVLHSVFETKTVTTPPPPPPVEPRLTSAEVAEKFARLHLPTPEEIQAEEAPKKEEIDVLPVAFLGTEIRSSARLHEKSTDEPTSKTPLQKISYRQAHEQLFPEYAEQKLAEQAEKELQEKLLKEQADAEAEQQRAIEREKIKGAVRTDFILSAEIVVIALGTVATAPLNQQIMVLSIIAVAMTIGVYGLVAMIVKIDDLGLHLTEKTSNFAQSVGRGLLAFAPILMKFLSIVGTLAMFLVGGGIINHAVPFLHHLSEHTANYFDDIAHVGHILGSMSEMVLNFAVGLMAGGIILIIVTLFSKLFSKQPTQGEA